VRIGVGSSPCGIALVGVESFFSEFGSDDSVFEIERRERW